MPATQSGAEGSVRGNGIIGPLAGYAWSATLISLYRASGSGEIQLLGEARDREEWTKLRNTAVRLLRARHAEHAAGLLEEYPFILHEGTNSFGDEFSVLYLSAPMAQYVDLAERERDPASKASFRTLAETLSEIGPYVRFIAVALDKKEGPVPVSSASPQITSDAVEQALKDAEQLIASRGATSGVDRVHTAFHGFLLAVCKKACIEVRGDDPGVTQLFKAIRERHPAFGGETGRQEELLRITRAVAMIVDALNPLRNRASLAHPNESLLAEPEAMLVINSVRTLLHYIDSRVHGT